LPNGVGFGDNGDGTGTLAGLPTAGTGGTYNITFSAQNGVPPDAQQNFTLTITRHRVYQSGQNYFKVGTAGSFTVTAPGFPIPNITEIGTLPNGVQFVETTTARATLSGGTRNRPTDDEYFIRFTAANGVSPKTTQYFKLHVAQDTFDYERDNANLAWVRWAPSR